MTALLFCKNIKEFIEHLIFRTKNAEFSEKVWIERRFNHSPCLYKIKQFMKIILTRNIVTKDYVNNTRLNICDALHIITLATSSG